MTRQMIIRLSPPEVCNDELFSYGKYYDDDSDDSDDDNDNHDKNEDYHIGLEFEKYDPQCSSAIIYYNSKDNKSMPWALLKRFAFEYMDTCYCYNIKEYRSIVLPDKVYVIVNEQMYKSPYPEPRWLMEGRIKAGFFKYE